ncbi:hypothetical protein ONE63_010784 [Megalurothrips usitatus]|uniref:Uncharacterized protein n=1 Tax=Megalurothrips usitatus TaxID=439358 RepID=A0AAV7XH20_9NEOP|nr:hypothetical protein ONE63_010784 [Megalurothrips usitatus]
MVSSRAKPFHKDTHRTSWQAGEDEGWGSDGDPGAASAVVAAEQEGAAGPGAVSPKEAPDSPSPEDSRSPAASPEAVGGPGSPGDPGGAGGTPPPATTTVTTKREAASRSASRSVSPASDSSAAASSRPPSRSPSRPSSRPRVVDLSAEDAVNERSGSESAANERPASSSSSSTTTTAAGGAGGAVPPRLRLNPSLATDPAASAGATALPPGGARRDYLSALHPAIHSAGSAGVSVVLSAADHGEAEISGVGQAQQRCRTAVVAPGALDYGF